MDGQNFENENNVTVDTTATEVSSAAETVQETPVTEQPVNIIRIIPQMYSLRQLQQLLYSSRRTKKPMYWLLSAWYWVSFPSYLDAAPDGSAHCLESVVSFAQYLPTSRARPAWQRLD